MLLAYAPELGVTEGDTTIGTRGAGRAQLSILPRHIPLEWHIYIAFVAYDQSMRSNSQYLGSITI